MKNYPLLDTVDSPKSIKQMTELNLKTLASEIRQFMLFYLSKTGGHLASNLGVVELTLALHYVFDTPKDKLVWDVGHQTYPHKIITNRKELFHSIRQFGGISGFPKRNESEFDCFETGHSSTSISAALGIARARDVLKQDFHVAAIIGDGSLTGGMAFEALNDAGHSKTNITVIINDNQMSISNNVGALSNYLTKIRVHPKYALFSKYLATFFDKLPILGDWGERMFEKFKKTLKYFVVRGIFFEELGFRYLGPVDGHDLENLITLLKRSKEIPGPVLIHVVTKKGKGYDLAELEPDKFHSVPPFALDNGEFKSSNNVSYSQTLGEQLVAMAKCDGRVAAVTAAMTEGTGLTLFKNKYPHRFFDVGIAEQHAVTMAAGLASGGMKPYVAIYSTFLQRAYDQILHDICIQNLPVTILIDRAGIAGEDGETHHGMFDIAFLRHVPNIAIWAPKDTMEFRKMLNATLTKDAPIAIRYEKGPQTNSFDYKDSEENLFETTWQTVIEGEECVILAFGRMLSISCRVAEFLSEEGISIQIVNARIIKPLDEKMLFVLSKKFKKWITLEDSSLQGGFGSSVNEFVINNNLEVSILNIGLPDRFIPHGKIEQLLEQFDINFSGVLSKVNVFLGKGNLEKNVN